MPTNNSSNKNQFQGFRRPTTTPVPDELFDELMHDLTGAELKVVLYICRRTFGFKKDSDSISLAQMVNGIKTKEGTILDHGTGLSKDSVARVTKSLEQKGIVIRNRNRSTARGDEPTTYSLNILPVSENRTPPRGKIGHGGVLKSDTQQTVIQETVEQHDDVVRAALQNFGVSKAAATRLAKNYPEELILEKLDLAQWLLQTGSNLVLKNPAGWLRKAIEEDYLPPRDYESPKQRQDREAKQLRATSRVAQQTQEAEAQYRQVKALARQQLLEQHPPQPIGGQGLNTETAWNQVLEQLQAQVPRATYETWLKDTVLLGMDGDIAQVMVPSEFAAHWLERRLHQSISRSLGSVLHEEVDIQFNPLPNLLEEAAP